MGDSCGRVLEWELGLPDAGELIPLSHSLISPTLAAAFQISLPDRRSPDDDGQAAASPISHLSWEEEEGEEEEPGDCHLVGGGSRGGRGLGGGKKRRMVWTPELHHRFVAAVAHLGPKGAVPKAIVQLMNVEGLTRENVASHLQKYRLYLKRMPANSGTSSSAMRGDQSSPPPAPQEEQRPVPRIGGWASHSALAPFAGVGHCHQPPLSAGQHVTGYYAYDFSWPRAKNVDCDSEQLLRWLLGNDSLLFWLLTILTFMVLCCKNGQPRLVKGLTDKACVILLHICLAVVPSSRRLLHFLNSVTAMIFCR